MYIIEDPNNVIPGLILLGLLPYSLLILMIYIYYKKIYKNHKIIYYIILCFTLIYVILATLWIYFMSSVGYKSGIDTIKIKKIISPSIRI